MVLARNVSAVLVACALSACANSGANYQPVIDGPVGPNYGADLAAASSVIVNDNSDNLAEAAAVGALVGVTGNAIQKNQQKEVIVRNCMRGRGYNVVG